MRLWHYVSQAILATSTTQDSHSTTTTNTNTDSLTSTAGTMTSKNTTIYFGYGSNLWRHQMTQRCPSSEYLGIARLNDYRWIINERGYANVVQIDDKNDEHSAAIREEAPTSQNPYANQVWGLVYTLQPRDESRLDRNEGVPVAYTKEVMECDFWAVEENSSSSLPANTSEPPEKVRMLVYINREQKTPSEPKREYVYRMNMGIRDAVKEGVPEGYVRGVMRRFIPEGNKDGVEDVARKQAAEFEDET